jgi:SAM-dependent methyltransferase
MASNSESSLGENLEVSRMPIYMLLARLGKRTLRPGGMELTRQMVDRLDVQQSDEVVEFAPGVGATAQLLLAQAPARYTAIDRDEASVKLISKYLKEPNQQGVIGRAEQTGLPDESATVVLGEAMLTLQMASNKKQIIAEAARILKPGGRYAIHELCLKPDDLDAATKDEIEKALSEVLRILWNVLRDRTARRRVMAMRSVIRRYQDRLAGIAFVAVKPE